MLDAARHAVVSMHGPTRQGQDMGRGAALCGLSSAGCRDGERCPSRMYPREGSGNRSERKMRIGMNCPRCAGGDGDDC